jgi:hypothetical protein
MAHFLNFIFILYPYLIFVKRGKLLSKKIKFKYENRKIKKKEYPAEVVKNLNYKIKS